MAGYNRTRYVEALLERTEALPPSFTIHLHLEYWTLNNGSKFLYNNQIASLLDDVRAHRIPVDFLELFEAARVPFYDGCMIVELLDYRPQRNKEPTLEKPERTRAVLHPNSETLWADICSLSQRSGSKWTDRDALEVEARLLLATSPPLCLDPDPHLARIANHVTRVSTPTVPVSLKRKAAALDPEEDETDKARRAKIMQFMNPRQNRTMTASYRILDAIQRKREKRDTGPEPPGSAASNTLPLPPSAVLSKPPTPSITVSQAHSPADSEDKKRPTPATATNTATMTFLRANGSSTPVPPPTTHQFINQNPPNPPTPNKAHSPLQPQVYPNVQAATEAARRTPTPAQMKINSYAPSSRPPPPSKTPAPPLQPPLNALATQTTTFQPSVPTAHFLNQPPPRNGGGVGGAPKGTAAVNGAKATPQQQLQTPQAIAHAHLLYAQQLQQGQQVQQQQILQQRLNAAQKNGRSTPQSQAAALSSPLVPNKQLRSPMPPTTQLPGQQQGQPQQLQLQQQAQQHPAQHPQHTFTPTYNPAHLRPMVHGTAQVPAHLAAAAAAANGRAHTPNPNTNPASSSTPASDPTQPQQTAQIPNPQNPQQQPQNPQNPQNQLHMYTPQMYAYPTMNYTQMQAHQQRMYWQQQGVGVGAGMGMPMGVGRGMPMVNGQAMAHAHAQQVAAKAGSAGIQGR